MRRWVQDEKSVEFNTNRKGKKWIFSRVGIREKIEIKYRGI